MLAALERFFGDKLNLSVLIKAATATRAVRRRCPRLAQFSLLLVLSQLSYKYHALLLELRGNSQSYTEARVDMLDGATRRGFQQLGAVNLSLHC